MSDYKCKEQDKEVGFTVEELARDTLAYSTGSIPPTVKQFNQQLKRLERKQDLEYLDKVAIEAMNALMNNQLKEIYKNPYGDLKIEYAKSIDNYDIAKFAYEQAQEMLKVRKEIMQEIIGGDNDTE